MNAIDLSRAEWRKSGYSSQSGNCVEVAINMPGTVAIRDSKDTQGPILVIGHDDWQALTRQIKGG